MATTAQKLNDLKPAMEYLLSTPSLDLTELSKVIGSQITDSLNPRQLWAIRQSLQGLENSVPNIVMLLELSRKVLENKKFILEGYPIPAWDGSEITVTVGVCSCKEKKSKIGTLVEMTCRGLTNLVAGLLLPYETTVTFAYRMMKRDLGLSKCDYMLHPLYLTGMQFNVVMLRTEKGFIKWTKIWATQSQKKKNKKLLEDRYERTGCNKTCKGPCYRCRQTRAQCRCAVK